MNENYLTADLDLASVIDLKGLSPDDFIDYYKRNAASIDKDLQKHGALKFTGVEIDSVDTFQHITGNISSKFLRYVDGNSPRTKLAGDVYTSTEYDKTQRITMHNELSYSAKWPNKLFFSCLIPAETGGETLLADSREILKALDPEIVSEVERKGIIYIRNLHGGTGLGPSWQDTFETTDKLEMEEFCKSMQIDFEWTNGDTLKIKQTSPGIINHSITNEKVWFNQVDQFHPCHLGEEMYQTMQLVYEKPQDFPMYVMFGDGSDISESMIEEILKTIDTVTMAPKWNENELLIVDNVLMSHGRNSFTGDRKVVVSMSE